MGPTLRKRLKKILLFSTLIVGLAFQGVYGQTELSPGDIAIVTVNADGDDNFDIVPLVDLEPNTEIKFTDAPYIEANSQLDDSEGTLTYTASSTVAAGDVVSSDDNDFVLTSGSYAASVNGDNIIAYQVVNNDTTYLYGIGWARGDSWNYNGDTNSSDIPPNLSEEDNTIVDLGTTDNYQYEAGNGLEGTANSLLSLIGNISNWNEDDESTFSSFSSSFTLFDPPTIAFTVTKVDSTEDSGTAELTIELVEENGTAVDADVVFLSKSSTATNGDDFTNFKTETVSFTNSDGNGTTKTISINLSNDSDFEGTEKAVFQLQNNTEGTIIEPSVLTLNISDDDAPDIVFNEINADPGNDANGDGTFDTKEDEFVEFVNNEDEDIDISSWEFFESSFPNSSRFTFPEGTVIPAGGAVVVFDDTATTKNGKKFGGSELFYAGSLSLNNSSETLTLENSDGKVVSSATYPNEASGESNVLSPEVTGDSYVDHSTFSSNDLLSSPGTDVDGNPFGSKHAVAFRGSEGWRMISSPVKDASFDDLLGDLWMQGLSESNDPKGDLTLASWTEVDTAFTVPSSMTETMTTGKGYVVYVFEDDDYNAPGIQGGFPKIINTDKAENENTVDVPVSATDGGSNGITGNEGWNLLGNPYDTDILAAAVIDALEAIANEADVNANVYVWDHQADGGSGDYVILDGSDSSDDTIAPFQAFFVRFTTDIGEQSVQFDRSVLEANTGTEFYKDNIENVITFDLQLHGEQYFDTYSLEFSENGSTELDRYDAYKLFSLNPNAVSLFSTLSDNRLQKNALPIDLKSNLQIPLSFDANGRSEMTFRWDDSMEEIPNEWDMILIDNDQNREIDLRRNNEYSFTVNAEQSKESQSATGKKGLLNKTKVTQDSRFTLSVQPNDRGGISSDLPESVKLKPNYPNPFNPTTTIPFELTEDSDVLLTVWNMIGQKVETLIDGTVEAGTHEATWNASNMPSGMYIARFEVNGTVFTRKMTLIK